MEMPKVRSREKTKEEFKKELRKTREELVIRKWGLKKTLKGMKVLVKEIIQKKKEIEEAKSKDEAILASISDAVFGVDKNLRITMFNRAAEKMTGSETAEVIGKNYHEVLHFIGRKDDKTKGLFIHEARSNIMHILKDGREITVAESAALLKNMAGDILGYVIVFRDISQEQRIEQDKDDFLNIAAHDLRTPMAGIRANAEMILGGDYGEIPPKFKTPLQNIDQANLNLIKIVDNFLTIARIEKGKIAISLRPTDLAPILNSVVNQMKLSVAKTGLKLDYEIPAKLPRVIADPDKISEVVINLLDNAVKFTDQGSITLRVLVKGDSVVVAITDTGIGIAPERQKNLFQKYTQVSSGKRIAHGSKGTGLGLGLYISRRIVESCGGKIWAESKLGRGSTFCFSLLMAKIQAGTNI